MIDQRALVRVRILGEEYALRTEASPEHTKAVADHVDRTIRAIVGSGTGMEPHKAAILAALQITDELFKERGATEELAGDLRQLASDIRPLLPPAMRGDDSTG